MASQSLSQMHFSHLDEVMSEVLRLQQENLYLQIELAELRQEALNRSQVAKIEKSNYSRIKKIFRRKK